MNANPQSVCVCGHQRVEHIYDEGPCRPGFVCEMGCQAFDGGEYDYAPDDSVIEHFETRPPHRFRRAWREFRRGWNA